MEVHENQAGPKVVVQPKRHTAHRLVLKTQKPTISDNSS